MNGSVGDKNLSGEMNKEHLMSFTLVACCALGSLLAAVAVAAAVAAATGSGTSPLRLARISATLRFSTVLGVPGVPGVEAPPVVTIRPPGLPPPAAAASATLLLMAAAAFSPLTRVTICDPSPWLSRFLRNKGIWEP